MDLVKTLGTPPPQASIVSCFLPFSHIKQKVNSCFWHLKSSRYILLVIWLNLNEFPLKLWTYTISEKWRRCFTIFWSKYCFSQLLFTSTILLVFRIFDTLITCKLEFINRCLSILLNLEKSRLTILSWLLNVLATQSSLAVKWLNFFSSPMEFHQ